MRPLPVLPVALGGLGRGLVVIRAQLLCRWSAVQFVGNGCPEILRNQKTNSKYGLVIHHIALPVQPGSDNRLPHKPGSIMRCVQFCYLISWHQNTANTVYTQHFLIFDFIQQSL